MSGPKRNPDRLNTIGVVVVGICGAVLVYVTITALQAFYVGDTSEIQTMADYGGQDTQAKNIRAQQALSLTAPTQPNPRGATMPQTFHIPLKHAMDRMLEGVTTGEPCLADDDCLKVATCKDKDGKGLCECRSRPGTDAKDPKNHVCVDLAHLIPLVRSDRATTPAHFGRPQTAPPPAPAQPADGAGSAAPAGAGSAAPADAGSGAGSATTVPPGGPAPAHQPAGTTAPKNAAAKGNGK